MSYNDVGDVNKLVGYQRHDLTPDQERLLARRAAARQVMEGRMSISELRGVLEHLGLADG